MDNTNLNAGENTGVERGTPHRNYDSKNKIYAILKDDATERRAF